VIKNMESLENKIISTARIKLSWNPSINSVCTGHHTAKRIHTGPLSAKRNRLIIALAIVN
jgi:hypothetical protein